MPKIRRITLGSQPTTEVPAQREATSRSWFASGPEQAALPPNALSLSQSKLIMVIDDSPTVRKIIEVCLRREGLEVISYPDGIEALRAVTNRQLDRLPDLVILDLDLPKMNGFEIARYMRSKPQWSRTIIVILSRHDGILDRLKARLAGTQAYLTKPFTTQVIIDVVQTALQLPLSVYTHS
jgi:twitching motility two-component system response regulator PilG